MNSIIYQFLNEPRRIRGELVNVEREIEDLRATMLPGGIRYDKDNVMSSPDDPMVRYAERLDPLLRMRDRLRKEYAVACKEFDDATGCLTDKQRTVIRMKYLDGMSNTDIGDALRIDRRNVLRMCERAYELLLNRLLTAPTGMMYDVV